MAQTKLAALVRRKLISCHRERQGSMQLNVTIVAERLDTTRQTIHATFKRGWISASLAFRMSKKFAREITVDELSPYIRRADENR